MRDVKCSFVLTFPVIKEKPPAGRETSMFRACRQLSRCRMKRGFRNGIAPAVPVKVFGFIVLIQHDMKLLPFQSNVNSREFMAVRPVIVQRKRNDDLEFGCTTRSSQLTARLKAGNS
jgi:hypothetical protein